MQCILFEMNRNNPNKCCSCIKFIATPNAFDSYTTVIVLVNGNNMRVEIRCWLVEGMIYFITILNRSGAKGSAD